MSVHIGCHLDIPIFTCSISYSSLKPKISLCCCSDTWSWISAACNSVEHSTEKIQHRLFRFRSTPWTILCDWLVQTKGWRPLVMLLSDVMRSYGRKCDSPRNTSKQKEQSSHKGYLHKYREASFLQHDSKVHPMITFALGRLTGKNN